jgi:hypothetical protein
MSGMPVRVPRRPAAPEAAPRPALHVVAPPRRRSARVAFIITCGVLLVGGMAAALALNIAMAEDAFEKHTLEQEMADLAEQRAIIVENLNQHLAPAALAEAAQAEGMVPGTHITYIRLSDGTTIGQPVAVGVEPEDEPFEGPSDVEELGGESP